MSSPEDFIRDNSEGCDESDFERILAKLKGPLEKFNAEVRVSWRFYFEADSFNG